MDETMQSAYEGWADIQADRRSSDFRSYVYNIAEARYVMRRVTRIVNHQAKKLELDPLLHQALLQIYGVKEGMELAVGALADRLDVTAAFASRLVSQLEQRGLARREPSTSDRRVMHLHLTEAGVDRLREIDDSVQYHIAYLHRQFEPAQRYAALSIFAFYVGIESTSPIASAIRSAGGTP